METKVYMVIRYADERDLSATYCVDDNYYLVGIFADKKIAEAVKEMELVRTQEDGDFVSVHEVDLNKVYEHDDQLYVGGGRYYE